MSNEIHEKKEIVKLEEKLGADFFAGLRVSSEEELKNRIKQLALDAQTTRQAMKDDVELQDLLEQIKEIRAPYLEAERLNRMRQRAIFLILQEKGN